tara:strand:- start:12804 stop:14054 length:1251 start_codon:yes stop_codon:yes gene_type:complete
LSNDQRLNNTTQGRATTMRLRPYFRGVTMINKDKRYQVINGDCMALMKECDANTFSAILSDPPYGLAYMGSRWDYDVPSVEHFAEMLRITKSGGYAFIFGGSRTFHRMAVNMEDAGWQLRDTMMWLYASGFPKSLNISKGIDKHLGLDRETIAHIKVSTGEHNTQAIDKPNSEQAHDFNGYGTGLKPAFEPIIIAMKPMTKTFVKHAIEDGVSGLNIDGCRIGQDVDLEKVAKDNTVNDHLPLFDAANQDIQRARWPSNIMQDGSNHCDAIFGEHSRAFMCSKPSKEEKDRGLDGFKPTNGNEITNRKENSAGANNPRAGRRGSQYKNTHPTVKPVQLMAYLATMLKMPNDKSLILDPYCGSGTTLVACKHVGIKAVGFELSDEYAAIASARCDLPLEGELEKWRTQKDDNQLKLF